MEKQPFIIEFYIESTSAQMAIVDLLDKIADNEMIEFEVNDIMNDKVHYITKNNQNHEGYGIGERADAIDRDIN